jgi:hypothetical protein
MRPWSFRPGRLPCTLRKSVNIGRNYQVRGVTATDPWSCRGLVFSDDLQWPCLNDTVACNGAPAATARICDNISVGYVRRSTMGIFGKTSKSAL